MKKYNFIMLLFFILLAFLFKLDNVEASLPLIGKTIILDAGHGGVDPGTVYEDIYEKDINLNIVLSLEEELIKLGAVVILTRDGDYDLSSPGVTARKQSDFDNRIDLINSSGANLYISIHMNYLNDSSCGGTGVFYLSDNYDLAFSFQTTINEYFGFTREVKEIPSTTYMYSKLNVPGILIECGFLSNSTDRTNFLNSEYVNEYASVLAKAIVNFY